MKKKCKKREIGTSHFSFFKYLPGKSQKGRNSITPEKHVLII
jgi:hypothetical protein